MHVRSLLFEASFPTGVGIATWKYHVCKWKIKAGSNGQLVDDTKEPSVPKKCF
jgi:hypothetical protein